MPLIFDPLKRPEENLADFYAYLKEQDQELGQLLESMLSPGQELSARERATVAKEAVVILKKRARGANDG